MICLGKNTGKYVTNSIPVEKEVTRTYKKGKEITKITSYGLQFFDNAKQCKINLAKGIHEIKCEYGHDDKKCEICAIKCKDYACCLELINFKDDLIEHVL